MRGARVALGVLTLLAAIATSGAEERASAALRWRIEPPEATVGDRLAAVLEVELPPGMELQTDPLGPTIGPFAVSGEGWTPPPEPATRRVWTWKGTLSAYETGDLEIPAVPLHVRQGGQRTEISTEPVRVRIRSVLEEPADPAAALELAGPKPEVSLPPDYRPLRAALAALGALCGVALLLWWLHRRYAARFAAVPAPQDPFHRTPPHVWVYRELQQLLELRLAEQGQVDRFYSEIARILKQYLGGRYRLELLERTTEETPELLRQAGAVEAASDVARLLARCDRVKFAGERPGASAWREAVDEVYAVVDRTRPADAAASERGPG